MDNSLEASVSGPGWTAEVHNTEHTVYAVLYTEEGGRSLKVTFDPREDGPNVYTNLDVWTKPADQAISESDKTVLIERLSLALNAYFKNDTWRLWTASWPRFPLAWKGPELFFIEYAADKWVQYSEPGRSMVLPCKTLPSDTVGAVPAVQVDKTEQPMWAYPTSAGAVSPTDWERIQQRLAEAKEFHLEWV